MYSEQFLNEMKTRLLEQKQKFEEDLSGLVEHEEIGTDYDENAMEVENDEVSKNLIARITEDLGKVDRALEKIEQGTYGVDDDGNQIAEDRLRAIPWADKAI